MNLEFYLILITALFVNQITVVKSRKDYQKIKIRSKGYLKARKSSELDNGICGVCETAVAFTISLSNRENSNFSTFPEKMKSFCNLATMIYTKHVCRGMVDALKHEVIYLMQKLNFREKEICWILFPKRCSLKRSPWKKIWKIKMPKIRKEPRDLKVLQISDIHLDLKYSEGSEVDCDDPLCCRQKVSSPKRSAGFWGTRANCDIPFHTFDHLLKHLSNQTFDYIMWTGDLPAHDSWEQSRSKHVNLIKNLTDVLTHYFPKTRVYPSLGNHESYPVNSFPPHYINDSENNISWLYNKLAEAWRPWLDEAALQTVRLYGYYTLLHQPGFRIISLNMNYCNDMNYWTLVDAVDPDHQLRWLVQILSDAERKGEKVHILGHIPPAVVDSNCLTVWRNNYYRIIARFSHIITAQFFGHTHTDEIEVIYANKSRDHAIGVAYVSPSVTTYSNLDPAYRVYDVSQRDWTIINHYTFIMNLTEANQSEEPRWQLLYDVKSEYNLTNLQPVDWHKLLKRWNCEHPTSEDLLLFQKYYRNFYKGNPPQEFCDEDCRSKMLSKMAVSTRPRFS